MSFDKIFQIEEAGRDIYYGGDKLRLRFGLTEPDDCAIHGRLIVPYFLGNEILRGYFVSIDTSHGWRVRFGRGRRLINYIKTTVISALLERKGEGDWFLTLGLRGLGVRRYKFHPFE